MVVIEQHEQDKVHCKPSLYNMLADISMPLDKRHVERAESSLGSELASLLFIDKGAGDADPHTLSEGYHACAYMVRPLSATVALSPRLSWMAKQTNCGWGL